MDYKPFRGSLDPSSAFGVLDYKKEFKRAHPEYFDPDGIIVFCGAQGQGKTISAVSYVLRLIRKYPDVVICSNVSFQDQSDFKFIYGDDVDLLKIQCADLLADTGIRHVPFIRYDSVDRLSDVQNGYSGVIYLIDEMHLEFNSLESKQLDSSIFYTVSQQRKQRKHIVGTSQVFQRLAKPFREQFKYVVSCRCYAGFFQVNSLIDALKCTEKDNGKIVCHTMKRFFWFHSPELYESYDTLQVIKRTRGEWKK